MKMNSKEIGEIKSMMNNYRSIHEELAFYEKELNIMSECGSEKSEERISYLGIKIKKCVESLNSQRKREKDMYSELEKKYGPGKIDIKTFEYKR